MTAPTAEPLHFLSEGVAAAEAHSKHAQLVFRNWKHISERKSQKKNKKKQKCGEKTGIIKGFCHLFLCQALQPRIQRTIFPWAAKVDVCWFNSNWLWHERADGSVSDDVLRSTKPIFVSKAGEFCILWSQDVLNISAVLLKTSMHKCPCNFFSPVHLLGLECSFYPPTKVPYHTQGKHTSKLKKLVLL